MASSHRRILKLLIKVLSALLDAHPMNCRVLCDIKFPGFLLRLAHQFPVDIRSISLQLTAQLLSYDSTTDEVRLLFQLACISPDEMEMAIQHAKGDESRSHVDIEIDIDSSSPDWTLAIEDSGRESLDESELLPSEMKLIQSRIELQRQMLFVIGTGR